MNQAPTAPDATRSVYPETLGRAPSGKRLAGRRILVVGGGQRPSPEADPPVGNGRAIAVLCAREGAHIACLDLLPEAAQATCDIIKSEGGSAVPLVADVIDPDAIARAVAEANQALGGLDGLALNVGYSPRQRMDDLTVEAWDRAFDINVRSNMLFAQHAMRIMAPGSSIVLISSVASLRANPRNPGYEASKASQVALARSIARAGEPVGIRCNSIAPGLIDTPMGRDASLNRAGRAALVPFGRQGTGWEVGYAALFLMSHEASYVNGHCLVVDGGLVGGIYRD